MHILFSLLFILFLSAPAYSQEDLSSFTGKEIRSIEIVSGTGITEKDLERECGQKKGDILTAPAVRACVTSFYQKGLFKDIIAEAHEEDGGVLLRYTFIEKTRAGNISILGNEYFSDQRLKSATGLKRGDELTEDAVSGAKNRILDRYRGSGFFEASVEIEAMPTGKGQEAELLIKIDEGKRARIEDIDFTGNKVWSDKKLEQLLKLRRGDYYSEKLMDQSLRALDKYYVEKGHLKALISPPELLYDETKGEVLVTISIDAGPAVEALFEGVEAMDPKTLEKELLIWKERAFDSSVLDESADRLTQIYQERGYYFAKITYRIERENDKRLKIIFTVIEGNPVVIKGIEFTGNEYFNSKTLRRYLRGKERGFLLSDILNEDIREITNLYKNSGFLGVKVSPNVTLDAKDNTLSIIISVTEGVQTFITDIQLKGNNAFSRDEIMAHIKSKEGKPYNESMAIDDLYNIQSFYVQKGYIYSSVDMESKHSDDRRGVIISYIITEDMPVYIGEIHASGNSFTKEYVIRRELLIKEGDLYSYENILRSRRKLSMLGLFRDIRLDPLNPEVKEYRKDMSLRVQEGYPGTVEFGVGYGDVERLRGMFEASYRNLFGTARQISLRAEGSSIEQKYSISYKEPWILGYQMDARLNLVDLFENKRSFDRRTLGLTTGIDKSFSDYVKGSLLYQYEDVKLSSVSAEAILTPEDTGKVEVATINPSITMDWRNDPFNPSRGTFYSIGFREAARVIGSRPQFAKVNLQGSFFYPPIKKVVLAFSVRGGVAWNFGESEEVPIFERYFIGGRSTVRGYDQERLGIPDKTVIFDGKKWNPTGGNMMMVMNGEIRFPLFRGLGMVAFVDSGNVWKEMNEFDIKEIRSTAGGGIRYDTPVGPLRLDVGCKLDRERGEDRCLPHFTLGHAF